jgi:predicted ester cyclase
MAETATKPKRTRKKGAKTLAREYFEALGRQDLDAAVALWRDGSRDHFHGIFDTVAPDGIRQWFSELYAAFPDFEMEILEIAASGDNAAVRWRGSGTFSGPGRFQGLAPNGSRVELEGCDMLRVADGQIVENNAYTNGVEIAQQLGVLPPEGSFGEKAVTGLVNARTAATDAIRRFRERG